LKKIVFKLEQDQDGYPPAECENLWGAEVSKGLFRIDNIPFFVRGISPGDIVSVEEVESVLYFKALIQTSSTSVLRVFASKESDVPGLRRHLRRLGCQSELSHISRLFSVEVPQRVPVSLVIEFLKDQAAEEKLDYEEASVRTP
jgi:hypothetical protein